MVKAGDIVGTTLDDWYVVPAGMLGRFPATLIGVGEDKEPLKC